jgi:hypothetical protein
MSDFDWETSPEVVIHRQPAVAVQVTATGVTIRQEDPYGDDNDLLIDVSFQILPLLIAALSQHIEVDSPGIETERAPLSEAERARELKLVAMKAPDDDRAPSSEVVVHEAPGLLGGSRRR